MKIYIYGGFTDFFNIFSSVMLDWQDYVAKLKNP